MEYGVRSGTGSAPRLSHIVVYECCESQHPRLKWGLQPLCHVMQISSLSTSRALPRTNQLASFACGCDSRKGAFLAPATAKRTSIPPRPLQSCGTGRIDRSICSAICRTRFRAPLGKSSSPRTALLQPPRGVWTPSMSIVWAFRMVPVISSEHTSFTSRRGTPGLSSLGGFNYDDDWWILDEPPFSTAHVLAFFVQSFTWSCVHAAFSP